ncbi:metal ABC transporter permease [Neptuniibacter caesariensis]|uniref:Putative permease of ABC transporter n=1 Tax=Neptuniibacter caesariensis TaxID=207954 RepID=A0A7U8C504_NEPCE|nr:metal ABC transporter permease [Neptuniibacter caesariensis]EAR60215.1 putative permease of ABC transporter [Oceanospirillum sp. MED92] [Neptuniibacter caesariensis]
MESLRNWAFQLQAEGVLPGIFEYGFLINALVAALIIGPLLGGMGSLVVIKRLAFFSEAVGHAALTGIAIGILLGEPAAHPYASLFSFCLIFALLLHWIKSRTQVPYDALVGVFLAVAIAMGAALLLYVARKVNIHIIENVLFGSILTVQDRDLFILAVIGAICLLLAIMFGNQALLASLNPELARVNGINTRLFDYIFVVMIALITVAAVKIAGAILVGAMLLIPATTARLVTRNIRQFFWSNILLSTLCCVVGIIMPMALDLPIPSGAAIVLLASLGFVLAVIFNRLKAIA